jgi:hypothetical protein
VTAHESSPVWPRRLTGEAVLAFVDAKSTLKAAWAVTLIPGGVLSLQTHSCAERPYKLTLQNLI